MRSLWGARGHAAGFRTTVPVGLAASKSGSAEKEQGAAGITTTALQFRGCSLSFVGELLSTC